MLVDISALRGIWYGLDAVRSALYRSWVTPDLYHQMGLEEPPLEPCSAVIAFALVVMLVVLVAILEACVLILEVFVAMFEVLVPIEVVLVPMLVVLLPIFVVFVVIFEALSAISSVFDSTFDFTADS